MPRAVKTPACSSLDTFEIEPVALRFAAWWQGEPMSAPLVDIGLGPDPNLLPRNSFPNVVGPGVDPEAFVDWQLAVLRAHVFMADSIPRLRANVGPDLTATPWGVQLELGANTSWAHPVVHQLEDWDRYLEREFDFSNPYWQTIESILRIALDKRGRALVELPDLHGNFDILTSVRGPENLCLDLVDDPDRVQRAAVRATVLFRECFRRLWALVSASQPWSISWLPFLHQGPAYIPSCDFWCLTDSSRARELVLPAIKAEMLELERSIFHLDGPDALRHLDLLLELPSLHALQWVYGAGRGPAARWIDVYRKIQAAGKGFLVHAENPQDALRVFHALGPQGMWLSVGGFDGPESAGDFLRLLGR